MNIKTIKRCLNILSKRDRRKLIVISWVQALLGILDLVGIGLIGLLSAMTIQGVTTGVTSNKIQKALEFLNISSLDFQTQVAILGLSATFFLIFRTLLTVFFTRKTLRFISAKGAELTANLVNKILTSKVEKIDKRDIQHTIYTLTEGVNCLTLGVLGNASVVVADASVLMIIGIALLVLDPFVAIGVFLLFGIVGYGLHNQNGKRAHAIGKMSAQLNADTNQAIMEISQSIREMTVKNRSGHYIKEIELIRSKLASALAEAAFLPNISKYVIESTLVLGALLLSASQFILTDSKHAFATLAVFLAAGARLAPALLRTQQGLTQISLNQGNAESTLKLVERLADIPITPITVVPYEIEHKDFNPRIIIKNLDFKYSEGDTFKLKCDHLDIEAGQFIALVGPSGEGKTTFADLILGVLPSNGSIKISGVAPEIAAITWPGAIAYVPQEVHMVAGSLKENIAMGFNEAEIPDENIWESLKQANLMELTSQIGNDLRSNVYGPDNNISGGQRQRIGIARAMLTKPKLIVFDEATSSLDANSENYISDMIASLRGETTVIVIAHRLSSIRNADLILYLEDGEIKASGKFEELRRISKNFDEQAKLMGL